MHFVGKRLRRIITDISATSLFISQHVEDKRNVAPVGSTHLSTVSIALPFKGIRPCLPAAFGASLQKTIGGNAEDDVALQGGVYFTSRLATPIPLVGFGKRLLGIDAVKDELDILAGGDLNYKVTVRGNDELSELARGIDEMRRSILEHQEAEEKMRAANSALVTAMSHDLRTPLTSLLGYLELMDRGKYKDEAQLKHFISRSLEKTLRIKGMADKLFEYFLVYSSEWGPPVTELLDADELVQQFWGEYAFSLENEGFLVRYELEPLNGKLRTDTALLRRAFDNLCSNLYKYADRGAEIRILCLRVGDSLSLSVSNGISPERGLKESTNIGLNTCARIIDHHGGSFSYFEEDSTFTVCISLPLE